MLGVKEYNGVDVHVGPSCHSPGCRGYGSTSSGVVFVGIAPGRDEIKTGRPLTGPSGKVLDAVLTALEYSRKDVYCTNLICWWKDEPSPEEAARCSDRLKAELHEIKPKFIILLGKIVAEIFTGKPFGKIRGAVQWNEEYQCYVMVTYHPAAILHGMNEYGSSKDDKASTMIYDFVRDLKKIKDVLTWLPGAPQAKVSYTVIRDASEAQRILDNLPRGYDYPVALDVETTYNSDDEEVEVFVNEILCIGFGTSEHAWVLTPSAIYQEDGKTPILNWPNDVWWVMQNALFDTQVMRIKQGVWIDVKEDTMLQSYSLDERSGIHRLKTQAREYLAAGFYEDDRGYGKKRLDEIPESQLYEYNAKDVCYTARLCVKYRPWQEDDNVRAFYEHLLIPAINMYKEIQFRGVKVDKQLHIKLGLMWGNRALEQEELLQDEAEQAGFPGRIELNSNQQLAKLLFTYLGLPVQKRTRKGAVSVDKEVLESLKGQHPFVEKMLAYRHLVKMFGTYIAGFLKLLNADDYIAHAIVKVHGSRTGRPSYTKPPLQTIPVPYIDPGDFGLLRNLFIPQSEDNIIIEADYGKAEIWMAYGVSGDPQLYEDLTSGDYHTTVSMDVLKKKKEEVTSEDRLKMKKVTFGIMYDREAPSLSEAINTSIIVAQDYINGWFRRNKVYGAWFRQTQQDIKRTGELVTKTGRKRRIIIVGNANRALKQAVNFPIQSTASDVLLDSAIELHQRIKSVDGFLLFTVHDSIVSEVPKSNLSEAVQVIHETMSAQRFDGVPRIPVEIKAGRSWGECKVLHECGSTKCLVPTHEKGCTCGLDAFSRTQKCLW